VIFLAKEKPGEVWYVFILWFASVIHNWHTHVIQATVCSNLLSVLNAIPGVYKKSYLNTMPNIQKALLGIVATIYYF